MHKILVIDDSRMIRMRVKQMLPSSNVEVVEARDGKEGIDLIQSQKPQLIILDFLLPKVSGWEVYQRLQNNPQLKGIPLVIMSGCKEEVTEKISEPFENFAFVEKPFEQDELVKAIKAARAKVPQQQAAAVKQEEATVPPKSEPEQEEDVAALQAKVTNLEAKVETMQGQINQLNKQMNQLVNFINKKLR